MGVNRCSPAVLEDISSNAASLRTDTLIRPTYELIGFQAGPKAVGHRGIIGNEQQGFQAGVEFEQGH